MHMKSQTEGLEDVSFFLILDIFCVSWREADKASTKFNTTPSLHPYQSPKNIPRATPLIVSPELQGGSH